MNKILVTRSSMPSIDEYVEEIKDIWDTHWLTNMGIKHKKLESELRISRCRKYFTDDKWTFIIGVGDTGNESNG